MTCRCCRRARWTPASWTWCCRRTRSRRTVTSWRRWWHCSSTRRSSKQQALLDGQFDASDHFCYDYSQLASIHRRRCQLRPTGIELLCRDGASHLLSFASKKERETVFSLIAKRAEARIRARSGQRDRRTGTGSGSPSAANVINTLTPSLNLSAVPHLRLGLRHSRPSHLPSWTAAC